MSVSGVSAEDWRATFSYDEWVAVCLLFGFAIRMIAAADGVTDDPEEGYLAGLWTGERGADLLSDDAHARLNSRPDVARAVLESWADGTVLAELTSGQARDSQGLEAPAHLRAWVARAGTAAETDT